MGQIAMDTLISEQLCPFCENETATCAASCSLMRIDDRTRMKYCGTENFDDCPIFLVRRLTRR